MNALRCSRDVLSPTFSILRQELDSMVRVIYLLSIEDVHERMRLIRQTLAGDKWSVETPKGKSRTVLDRDMVEIANDLNGWTESVYKFGCAFIHLSDFHMHETDDPFKKLPDGERADVVRHLRHYHGGPFSDTPSIHELEFLLPDVFRKIHSNLEHYVEDLEQGMSVEKVSKSNPT